MHPRRLFTGSHCSKFRLTHGVERTLNRWPQGVVNGLTRGVFAVLYKRIIPVTKHRRQGDSSLTGFCGCGGFALTVTVKVAVGGENNLAGRVLLPDKACQGKKVHGRQRHHHGFPGQVMHGQCRGIPFGNPQAFPGLFLAVEGMACPFHLAAFQGAFLAVSTD